MIQSGYEIIRKLLAKSSMVDEICNEKKEKKKKKEITRSSVIQFRFCFSFTLLVNLLKCREFVKHAYVYALCYIKAYLISYSLISAHRGQRYVTSFLKEKNCINAGIISCDPAAFPPFANPQYAIESDKCHASCRGLLLSRAIIFGFASRNCRPMFEIVKVRKIFIRVATHVNHSL